jgi:hypothetical protein
MVVLAANRRHRVDRAIARTADRSGPRAAGHGPRGSAAGFMKDFVVVKDLLRQSVENPSQQQKFT